MKTKLISLILLISILLSSFSYTYASPYNDGINEKAELLEQLGIIDTVEDESSLSESVTRRDFAILLAKMLGFDVYSVKPERYYQDMTESDLGWNATGFLVEKEILTVGEDKLFRPNDVITAHEAACAVMKCLGASNVQYDMYLEAARSVELMKGVSSMNLDLEDVIVLIHNVLNTRVFSYGSLSNGKFTLVQKEETFMEKYFNLFHVEGVVNSVGATSISSLKQNGNDTIGIDDLVLMTDGANYYDYLGSYVSAYYTDIDDVYTLKYIAVRENRTEKIFIDIDDFENFDDQNFKINYYENEKAKKADLETSVVVVKNGVTYVTDLDSHFQDLINGEIILIDADSDSDYETVIIQSYENVVVSYVDAEKKEIYGKNRKGIDLSDESVKTVIIGADGSEADLSQIVENTVISYYSSSKLNRLVISQTSVKGELTYFERVDEDLLVYINGTAYKVDKNYIQSIETGLGVGMRFIGYVDYKGKVALCELTRGEGGEYAWIVKKIQDIDEEKISLRVFTENEEYIIIPMAEKIWIDGVRCKTFNEKNTVTEGQLAVITVNEENEIIKIDTVGDGTSNSSDDNGLYAIASYDTPQTYFQGQSLLGPLVHTNKNTKVMIVPNTNAGMNSRENYMITGMSFFKDFRTYQVSAYRIGDPDSMGYAEIILLKHDITGKLEDDRDKICVIKDDPKVFYDEEADELRYKLSVVSGKNEYEYVIASGVSQTVMDRFIEGNVVRLSYNAINEVYDATVIYSKTDGIYGQQIDTIISGWAGVNQFGYGYIVKMENGFMGISTDRTARTPQLVIRSDGAGVAVFDEKEFKSVFVGSEADLLDAYKSGYPVVLNMHRGTVRSLTVIK